jgi:hypothetical protein
MAFTEPTEDIVEYGDALSPFVVDSDVTRGQVVKISGTDNQIAPSDTDGEDCLGVAVQTVASGGTCTVALPGCEVNFSATGSGVDRGEFLTSDGGSGNSGEVDSADASNDSVIGYSYEGASSSGDLVRGLVTAGGEVQ